MTQISRRHRASSLLRMTVPILLVLTGAFTTPRANGASAPHVRHFWVDTTTGSVRVAANFLASGENVSVYGARGSGMTAGQARSVVTTVEARILPTTLRLFGTPSHFTSFTILFVPLQGSALGYFNENDLTPPPGIPSNRMDLLYVRPPALMPDGNKMTDIGEVVAHELQHLIEYRIRVMDHHFTPEEDWLNEGLSFYAQIANGYWTERDALKVQAASIHPDWPVTQLNKESPAFLQNARVAYGRAGLFMTYLATRFGPDIGRRFIATKSTGMAAIDTVLRSSRRPSTVLSAFSDWSVATLLNERGIFGYGQYSTLLRPQPVFSRLKVSSIAGRSRYTLERWSQRYIRVSGDEVGTLSVGLHCSHSQFRVAVVTVSSAPNILPEVHWLHFYAGRAEGHFYSFGTVFDHAYVIVSDVAPPSDPSGAKPDTAQLTAFLGSGPKPTDGTPGHRVT